MISNSDKPTKEETETISKDSTPPEGYKGYAPKEPTGIKEEVKETGIPGKEQEKKEPETKPVEKTEKVVEKVEPKKEEAAIDDTFVKLERELDKPEGSEDVTSFSPKEKAYFYQMRRDRKLRQQAEADRDAAAFREMKLKKQLEKPQVEEEDPLKDKDPSDFLTVGEVKKLLAKKETQKVEETSKPEPVVADPIQRRYLKSCDEEARGLYKDYDEVMELVPELINTNSKYLSQVAESMKAGENPAEKMYTLIKSDKEFEKLYPVAQTRVAARKTKTPTQTPTEKPKSEEVKQPSEEAKIAQEIVESNLNKTKTTGHVGGANDKPNDEYSQDDIVSMSDREFSKLPKKTREYYLRKYG